MLSSPTTIYAPMGRVPPAAFDRQDGRLLFETSFGKNVGGTYALLAGGHVYTGTEQMVAFDQQTKDLFATFPARKMIVTEQRFYMATDAHLIAMDRQTKATLWKTPSTCADELILAGDMLFAGGADKVMAVETATGKAAWFGTVEGAAKGLAVAGGRLLVSTDKGVIYSFATTRPRPAGDDRRTRTRESLCRRAARRSVRAGGGSDSEADGDPPRFLPGVRLRDRPTGVGTGQADRADDLRRLAGRGKGGSRAGGPRCRRPARQPRVRRAVAAGQAALLGLLRQPRGVRNGAAERAMAGRSGPAGADGQALGRHDHDGPAGCASGGRRAAERRDRAAVARPAGTGGRPTDSRGRRLDQVRARPAGRRRQLDAPVRQPGQHGVRRRSDRQSPAGPALVRQSWSGGHGQPPRPGRQPAGFRRTAVRAGRKRRHGLRHLQRGASVAARAARSLSAQRLSRRQQSGGLRQRAARRRRRPLLVVEPGVRRDSPRIPRAASHAGQLPALGHRRGRRPNAVRHACGRGRPKRRLVRRGHRQRPAAMDPGRQARVSQHDRDGRRPGVRRVQRRDGRTEAAGAGRAASGHPATAGSRTQTGRSRVGQRQGPLGVVPEQEQRPARLAEAARPDGTRRHTCGHGTTTACWSCSASIWTATTGSSSSPASSQGGE